MVKLRTFPASAEEQKPQIFNLKKNICS